MIPKLLVHHRLLIQRGIQFVAIFVASLTMVGVWRQYLPTIHWYWWLFLGMTAYLGAAWMLGWLDERFLWRIETAEYSSRNPQLMEILTIVKRLEARGGNDDRTVQVRRSDTPHD